MSDTPMWPFVGPMPRVEHVGDPPSAGQVRIVCPTKDPNDTRVDVMQRDGTWLELRLCTVAVRIVVDEFVTATIVVEPHSVDVIAMLDGYAVPRVKNEIPPTNSEMWRGFIRELRAIATERFGPDVSLAQALEWFS